MSYNSVADITGLSSFV